MARDGKIPGHGTRKAPEEVAFELGVEENIMYFPLGIGKEREFQAEEMAGKQSLEGMKQIGLCSKLLEY